MHIRGFVSVVELRQRQHLPNVLLCDVGELTIDPELNLRTLEWILQRMRGEARVRFECTPDRLLEPLVIVLGVRQDEEVVVIENALYIRPLYQHLLPFGLARCCA